MSVQEKITVTSWSTYAGTVQRGDGGIDPTNSQSQR